MDGYFTYIITNCKKSVLYTGMTNDLQRRLEEHIESVAYRDRNAFTGRYRCQYLVYFEQFEYPDEAIKREKEIKGWKRCRKIALINSMNPNWDFLNDRLEELLSV